MSDTDIHDEPSCNHDQLIDHINARAAEEYERRSDAAESGALVKEFTEETGLNKKAYGWLKAIMKELPKKNGQQRAMDIIRSLQFALPMIENHVVAQGTSEMGLGEPAEQADDESAEIEAEAAEFEGAVDGLEGEDDDNVVKAFGG